MKSLIIYSELPMLFLSLFSFSWVNSANSLEDFLQCLYSTGNFTSSTSQVVYTPFNQSYPFVLQFSIQNKRFTTTSTPKPLVIVTPLNVGQIQASIICSEKHGLQIRVRSGGHDYEGLSYVSLYQPFVVIDMVNIRTVAVDVPNKTAWVQSGATLGELYYRIAEKSATLAFPAGVCPTVGVGGHFSGGGYGLMMRKFGLAADHVIDAVLIDVKGRILDRASMGEDLFWAIRGGGGNTFGIVVSWKIELVTVPPIVTIFNVNRTLEQNAVAIVHRWQYVADKFHEDIFTRIFINRVNSAQENSVSALHAEFTCLFLGRADRLLYLMKESFPDLGLVKEDCMEMSWIESAVYFARFPKNTPLTVFLHRNTTWNGSSKATSDYVTKPIPKLAIQEIWGRFSELISTGGSPEFQFTAYGGKMNEIPATSLPFAHRAGYIYQIHYSIHWEEESNDEAQTYIDSIRSIYDFMSPYVSKNPRAAYVNYRDLYIGANDPSIHPSYERAKIWGVKYFGKNFDRLVRVKTTVDPDNFFRNEQSVPPLSSSDIEENVVSDKFSY